MRRALQFRIVSWLAPLLLMACAAPGADPRVAAAATGPTASLTNTYWKLLTLGDTPVASPAGTRELHLILQLDRQRVAGFSGCNRLTGGYQVQGDKLSFTQVAGTMMACAPPAMELERSFHVMLGKVARWRIGGERLEVLDGSGAVLAVFESRYM